MKGRQTPSAKSKKYRQEYVEGEDDDMDEEEDDEEALLDYMQVSRRI